MQKLKVLGVSAGNGVLLYPFKKHVVANIEIRPTFATEGDKQWKLNFPKAALLKGRDIKNHGFPNYKGVDIIVGHPDCGAGSILRLAKSKAYTTSRGNASVDLYFDAVNYYKPKFFLFENLVAFFNSYPKKELKEIFKGYKLLFHTGPVSQWGNSQIGRKRLVIIGIREDQNIKFRAFKLLKQENIKLSTAGALEKLLASQLKHQNAEQLFHLRENDSQVMHMERNWKRLSLKEIRDEWDKNQSTKSWNAETHGKGRMKTLPGVYRNRGDDLPRAVLRNNRQFDPYGNIMSPRQLANIQGIPEDFKLYYNPNKLGYCLNKARVTIAKSPPHEIGKWFYNRIKRIYHERNRG